MPTALAAIALLAALTYGAVAYDIEARTCNIQNSNACLKASDGSWLQFCPYFGKDRKDVDGTDSGCIAIKPQSVSEYQSNTGALTPVRDASGGLRIRMAGSASIERLSLNCSTSKYMMCLPDDGDQKPIRMFILPMRMDLGFATIHLRAFMFGDSGVVQYGGLRRSVTKDQFMFDMFSDAYPFQSPDADGLRIEFLIRNRGQSVNSNSMFRDGQWVYVNGNEGGIATPLAYSYILADGVTNPPHTDPTTETTASTESSTAAPTDEEEEPTPEEPVEDTPVTDPTDPPSQPPTLPTLPSGQTTPTLPSGQTIPANIPSNIPSGQTIPSIPSGQTIPTIPSGQTLPTRPSGQTISPNIFPEALDLKKNPAVAAKSAKTLNKKAKVAGNGRKLLQQYADEMFPATYMYGDLDPEDTVLWGTADSTVERVGGAPQTLSITLRGRFRAFHYEAFVAAGEYEADPNSELEANSVDTNKGHYSAGAVVVAALVGLLLTVLA